MNELRRGIIDSTTIKSAMNSDLTIKKALAPDRSGDSIHANEK